MKKIIIPSLLVLLVTSVAFKSIGGGESHKTLTIGEKAPMLNHKMNSTSDKEVSLEDLKGDKGTIVMFSCNTCPFVIAWEGRYSGLASLAKENGISMALINSNEARRDGDDSMDEMKSHAKEKGYADIPYLLDEKSLLATILDGMQLAIPFTLIFSI